MRKTKMISYKDNICLKIITKDEFDKLLADPNSAVNGQINVYKNMLGLEVNPLVTNGSNKAKDQKPNKTKDQNKGQKK